MFKTENLIASPAMPAAILLYGIVFGFATWSYLGWPWQRIDTILLYGAIAVWTVGMIAYRWSSTGFSMNRMDIFFSAFVLWVLGSTAMHWWTGTTAYLEYLPFFVILPYLLGRTMLAQDMDLFRKILIGMGAIMLLLMPLEYWRNSQPGFRYVNAPTPLLFGHGHGVMLAGLMLSASLLALISLLMSPAITNNPAKSNRRPYLRLGYLMLGLLTLAMVWISSRGSVVAVALGIIALFLFSSFFEWKKKLAILLYIGLIALVGYTFSFQNKYHREYYQQLFVPPAASLNGVSPHAPGLRYGKPILGEATCKNISSSISERWIHYRTAWELFRAKPGTGVGANSYGFYSCPNSGQYPHTTVLQILAELGALGALLYFPLVWMMFSVPIKRYRTEASTSTKANMSWLIAFVILQFTTNQFNGNYFMSAGLYFVMGLAASWLNGVRGKRVKA